MALLSVEVTNFCPNLSIQRVYCCSDWFNYTEVYENGNTLRALSELYVFISCTMKWEIMNGG